MKEEWIKCNRCMFSAGRVKAVLGAGNLDAQIMMIGQWPGKDEDKLGIPVQGEGGKWVKAALDVAGIPWDWVFFDNILSCKPNATPKKPEKAACRPRWEETIDIVSPKLIIAAGAEASKALHGSNTPGSRLAGTSWTYKETIVVFSTTHPAEPLRMKSPDTQTASWKKISLEYRMLGDIARGLCILPRSEE